MVVVNGPGSITVTWQVPATTNGIIIRYEVTVSSSSLTSSGQGDVNVTDTSFMATMLSPFTGYTFEVAAVTGAGRGASVTITATTDEDGTYMYSGCQVQY